MGELNSKTVFIMVIAITNNHIINFATFITIHNFKTNFIIVVSKDFVISFIDFGFIYC